MYASVSGYTLQGIHGKHVHVEADVSNGLPLFQLVGLPSATVRESKERVRAAIQNSGLTFPMGRITVNLAPADLRKDGPGLDLSICIAILLASGQLPLQIANRTAFLGEIALDGTLLPVRGILSMLMESANEHKNRIFIPYQRLQSIPDLTDRIEIIPVHSLKECVQILTGSIPSPNPAELFKTSGSRNDIRQEISLTNQHELSGIDDIHGQWMAKKALLIAAAGGHHLLLSGSPGTGKTMLCRSFPRLLPQLSRLEWMEVQQIHGAIFQTIPETGYELSRPFRSPHHSVTATGLLGGGHPVLPGEITLAHHGALFLDELLEFPRHLLDQLREPLERKAILIARANQHITFPADFQLLAACNPCPCGYYGSQGFRGCSCTEHVRTSYQSRLSGPLLDRFDLRVFINHFDTQKTGDSIQSYSEAQTKTAVAAAWEIQKHRNGINELTGAPIKNSRLAGKQLESLSNLTQSARMLLNQLSKTCFLSGRGKESIIRVARTLADLSLSGHVEESHIAEASQMRRDPLTIEN